jgi:hypothetical protein
MIQFNCASTPKARSFSTVKVMSNEQRILKAIHLERFKRITDAYFDLQVVNVLVGANNASKSSVIQGVHFRDRLTPNNRIVRQSHIVQRDSQYECKSGSADLFAILTYEHPELVILVFSSMCRDRAAAYRAWY